MSKVKVRAAVALFESGEFIVMGSSAQLAGDEVKGSDILEGLKEVCGGISEPYAIRWIAAELDSTEMGPDIVAVEEAQS